MRILAALLIAASVSIVAHASEPTIPIERLQATLIEAMRGGERLGFDGRRKLVEPAMDQVFDLAAITRHEPSSMPIARQRTTVSDTITP